MSNEQLLKRETLNEMLKLLIAHYPLLMIPHSGALKTLSSEWNPATPPLTANFIA